MNKFQNHALRLNISFFKVISLECFEKSKANKKLLPLTSLKSYEIIYVETTPSENFDEEMYFNGNKI